jgi:NitT/TauT family transport system ATP-binding protein
MIAAPPRLLSSTSGRPVSIDGLRYSYPGAPARALDAIDLDVAAGEFVCLLGPSGCGKTTLLRLIASLLRPTEGSVDIGAQGRHAIGWMAQRDGLLPWRTLLDNVALPLELVGKPREIARASAQRELDRVGLARAARLYPHQLSGGMRQRAALARAVVHEPGLLLLDEPFAHLDELTREELGDELVRLWTERRPTVVLVTHSALEAVRLADRVVILSPSPGRTIGEVVMKTERPRDETDPEVADALRRARGLLRRAR